MCCAGDIVEGLFNGKKNWYKGIIAAKNADGTYKIEYLDGDVEKAVISDYIRFRKPKKPQAIPKGQGFIDGLKTEEARHRYWLECCSTGVVEDQALMIADDC